MIDLNERIMLVDTETTNSLDDPICYDVGYVVFDLAGNIYEQGSMVNSDIFLDKEFMASAYYAEKIPQYWIDIWEKKRELLPWAKIKWRIFDACKRNNCHIVSAHNARFDIDALNTTAEYLTGYRFRVLPDLEVWDSMKMARSIFNNRPSYKNFCAENGFMTKHKTPRCQLTAEVLYRFITQDVDFTEEHTALEDVKIESEIVFACYRAHKKMDKVLFPA